MSSHILALRSARSCLVRTAIVALFWSSAGLDAAESTTLKASANVQKSYTFGPAEDNVKVIGKGDKKGIVTLTSTAANETETSSVVGNLLTQFENEPPKLGTVSHGKLTVAAKGASASSSGTMTGKKFEQAGANPNRARSLTIEAKGELEAKGGPEDGASARVVFHDPFRFRISSRATFSISTSRSWEAVRLP